MRLLIWKQNLLKSRTREKTLKSHLRAVGCSSLYIRVMNTVQCVALRSIREERTNRLRYIY